MAHLTFDQRWPITAVASGLACAVLYAAAAVTVLGLPDTAAPGSEVAAYAVNHRTLLLAGSYLWGLAISANLIFAVAFFALLSHRGRPAEPWSLVAVAGALMLCAMEFVAFAILVMLAFRPVEPASARLLADLYAILLAYAGLPAALWTACGSVALWSTGLGRRWVGVLGLLAAIVHLVVAGSLARSGIFSPSGAPGLVAPVLIVAWIGAVSLAVAATASAPMPRILRGLLSGDASLA